MQKDSILIKIFLEKKGWIWLLILMAGMIALVYSLKVDLYPEASREFISWGWWPEIRHKLWQASAMVCEVLVAYSTMLAAVVIFYYSVTENKRLGIPYRRLIAYTVGPFTIPVLFVATLLLTVLMVVFHHMLWKHTMYVCAIYILFLQTYMIVEILRSTSHDYGKRVICQVERKNYSKKITQEESRSINRICATGHLEQAIHSDEFIQDKEELLAEFLRIPFQKKKGKLSLNNFRQEVFFEEEKEKMYLFYFLNLSSAFQNLDGKEKMIERNELYLCIGRFLEELHTCLKKVEGVRAKKNCKMEDADNIYRMVLSGIMNGMVDSNVEDNALFCDYIFEKCVPDDMCNLQLSLYVLFSEVFCMFDEKVQQKSPRIKKLTGWKPVMTKRDIEICADFWEIWVKVFNIPMSGKMKHFVEAMETMTGYGIESETVLEMILPMVEKQ